MTNDLNVNHGFSQTPISFRLLKDAKNSGAHNMAVDEALLRCISTSTDPILRFYGFNPPCISLGRFQPINDFKKDMITGTEQMGIVRRPTGGQAVLHDHEVTYAMILGRQHLKTFSKRNAYRISANILCRLLTAFSVTGIIKAAQRSSMRDIQNPNCFGATGEYEIITKTNHKLVGSAQTTTRQGTLQHGTIPLSTSYTKITEYINLNLNQSSVKPVSIGTETGHSWSYEDAQELLTSTAITELNAYLDNLTPEESKLVKELEKTRYKCKNWTRAK